MISYRSSLRPAIRPQERREWMRFLVWRIYRSGDLDILSLVESLLGAGSVELSGAVFGFRAETQYQFSLSVVGFPPDRWFAIFLISWLDSRKLTSFKSAMINICLLWESLCLDHQVDRPLGCCCFQLMISQQFFMDKVI